MVVNPYPPGGGSWFTPTGGTSWGANYAVSPQTALNLASRRPIPNATTDTSGGATPQDWDQYVQAIQQQIQPVLAALQAGAGQDMKYKYESLRRQYEDAEKGRQNAWQIAQLSAQTSRYGVDKNTEVQLEQLKQRQHEFERNHDLEMQRFGLEQKRVGLEYANTATQYLQTPDRYFMGSNYLNLAGRVLAGQPGQGAPVGQPTPKTEQDFANLAAGGTGQQAPTASSPAEVAQRAAQAGGAGGDERVKALTGVIKAVPPSATPGMDNNDQAVLAAAQALYSTNLNPGQFNAIKSSPTAYGITRSAIGRIGDSPDEWEARQRQNRLGFGSARAA